MKRSWIGFFLLLILLAGSIVVTVCMVRIHDPIEEDLTRASEFALQGDWENTDRYFRMAFRRWKQWDHFRACFADHTPMEEIDAEMNLLAVYCAAREDAAFSAESLSLARQIAAMGEAHEFVWWNIL